MLFMALAVILVVLIIVGSSIFYQEPLIEVQETRRNIMDTYVTITVYADKETANNAIEKAFERMEQIVNISSTWQETAEAYILNLNGEITNSSSELIDIIQKSIHYYNITNNSFDITIQPLLDLWNYKAGTDAYNIFNISNSFESSLNSENINDSLRTLFSNNQYSLDDNATLSLITANQEWIIQSLWHVYTIINTSNELGVYAEFWDVNASVQQQYIDKTKVLVGSDKIDINAITSSISFKKVGMEITLGGIAKGYAVDEAIKVLKNMGIKHALINAGGDLTTIGSKADSSHWTIALQDPENEANYITRFKISGKAIATSGNYERYYNESANVGHIMNPKTGYSSTDCWSVSIIADNCTEADALATGVFVMGPDAGMKLVESLQDVECLIIDSNGIIHRSSGLYKYEY